MRKKLLTKPTECNPVHALMSDSVDHRVPTGVELLKYCVNRKGPHHSTDLNVKHGYQHESYTKERYSIAHTAQNRSIWLQWRDFQQAFTVKILYRKKNISIHLFALCLLIIFFHFTIKSILKGKNSLLTGLF